MADMLPPSESESEYEFEPEGCSPREEVDVPDDHESSRLPSTRQATHDSLAKSTRWAALTFYPSVCCIFTAQMPHAVSS